MGAVLIGIAFLVPRLMDEKWRKKMNAEAAPIFGKWNVHMGWGTVPAILVAIAVVLYGPALARRIRWRSLLVVTWLTGLAWSFALVMVDGWQRGFVHVFQDPNEYLHEVGGVTDIPATLRGFSDRILDFQPDSWTTHVSGHPPGALLIFVWLDRIGLRGPTWAGIVCVLVGLTAALAVLIAVRALASEDLARSAAPFLAMAPAAIWIAVSADAIFAAITAWAVALLAIAATRTTRAPVVAALGAGVLFGFGIYVNYGLVLMGIPAVAVLVAARTVRPLFPALVGALIVAAAFTASGFWWLDGYHLVVQRYYQGIASERPYNYWVWANLAAATCATGLAVPAALHRPISLGGLRTRNGLTYLVTAAGLAMIAADLSALSKAETERIWLPFTIWLISATALLPERHKRAWLAVQATGALVLVHLILTNW
ncbi:hypothetical protein FOY51_18295 [Antrihabitans cavernicola]|uniref:Integral membrane protein n=1 Tax=Antrihabitans cavernicola TaxID=2495913 RepID=A0A5A7SAK9_9NOCA|nr:hypothetical protein [Spelaeibacter cavernicola]KAA0021593.1 hypothetical protein FOY51_18295 [Spelaeibacter cavernicola]